MWALAALMATLAMGIGACSAPVARRPGGPFVGNLGSGSEALFHAPRLETALAQTDEDWETWRNDYRMNRVAEADPYDSLAWPSHPRPSLWNVRYLHLPTSSNTQIWFEERSERRLYYYQGYGPTHGYGPSHGYNAYQGRGYTPGHGHRGGR